MAIARSRREVADIIENFLNGRSGERDWDDFISVPIRDEELNQIRLRCAALPEEFPAYRSDEYCSNAGREVLKNYATELRR